MGVPSGKSTFSHPKNDVEIHHFPDFPRRNLEDEVQPGMVIPRGAVGKWVAFLVLTHPQFSKKKLELDSQLDRKVLKDPESMKDVPPPLWPRDAFGHPSVALCDGARLRGYMLWVCL